MEVSEGHLWLSAHHQHIEKDTEEQILVKSLMAAIGRRHLHYFVNSAVLEKLTPPAAQSSSTRVPDLHKALLINALATLVKCVIMSMGDWLC